ncbi:hypothetical protein [Streptomyces olivaceus]|uniref:hypothetical protein n=1 Tax=Streptomyces olivaceus TaxID=47716 RepID=UPI0018858806|nr:hypothetical protein [Streptomyces olivaceus]
MPAHDDFHRGYRLDGGSGCPVASGRRRRHDGVLGADWFDERPGGFADAAPGRYFYDHEQTYAEYELDVSDDGTITFGISYVKVNDIVTMLAALERALATQRLG